jgi:hypothetical protein
MTATDCKLCIGVRPTSMPYWHAIMMASGVLKSFGAKGVFETATAKR